MRAWLNRLPALIVGNVVFVFCAGVFLVVNPPASTLARLLWGLVLVRNAAGMGARWSRRAGKAPAAPAE